MLMYRTPAPAPRRVSGQRMAELALVLPLLLLLFGFGMLELERARYVQSTIVNAARDGARFAATDPTNTQGIQNHVVTSAAGLGLTASDITVSCSPCTSGNLIRVDVAYDFRPASALILPDYSDFTLHTSARMYIDGERQLT